MLHGIKLRMGDELKKSDVQYDRKSADCKKETVRRWLGTLNHFREFPHKFFEEVIQPMDQDLIDDPPTCLC
jgi:hypothetical protein